MLGSKIGSGFDTVIHEFAHQSKMGHFMKKKTRIEIAKEIILSESREMHKPRLTESVRNGFSAQAAPSVGKPAAHSARP
jgi:hypothetical protein